MKARHLQNHGAKQICSALIGALVIACFWQAPATAQENRLGRLFYTPQEREKLDQKRGAVATIDAPQTVIVNGVVVRPGMAPILFLDGKEVRPGAAPAGVTLRPGANQSVELQSEDGPPVKAKAGQVIDLSSGRAVENYQLTPTPPVFSVEPAPPADTGAKSSPAASTPRAVRRVGAAQPQ